MLAMQEALTLQSIVSRHENGPGRIYTAVCSSKAAKTTTGEVIKQEKVVREGSCGILPHLYISKSVNHLRAPGTIPGLRGCEAEMFQVKDRGQRGVDPALSL